MSAMTYTDQSLSRLAHLSALLTVCSMLYNVQLLESQAIFAKYLCSVLAGTYHCVYASAAPSLLPMCCLPQALRSLIRGCGKPYQPFFNDTVQERLWSCLYHPNRFIRETAYSTAGDLSAYFAGRPLQAWGEVFAIKLQDGLSENWSQVRSDCLLQALSFPQLAYVQLHKYV